MSTKRSHILNEPATAAGLFKYVWPFSGHVGNVKLIKKWVKKILKDKKNEVRTIYLELDDKCTRQIRMSGSDVIAKSNKWVPIKREETKQHHQQLKEHNLLYCYPGHVQFTN